MIPSSPLAHEENIIAPLGMDLDLSGSNGADDRGVIYYNTYEYFDIGKMDNGLVKEMYERVKSEIEEAYGDTSFIPTLVTTVTWINCPRYPYFRSRNLTEVIIDLITRVVVIVVVFVVVLVVVAPRTTTTNTTSITTTTKSKSRAVVVNDLSSVPLVRLFLRVYLFLFLYYSLRPSSWC